MYEPEIGDVVFYKDAKIVIISCKNNEDYGSCNYDRLYKYLNLSEMPIGDLKISDLKILKISDTVLPFTKCEDEAPYDIQKITTYQIRRKIPKQITIYE